MVIMISEVKRVLILVYEKFLKVLSGVCLHIKIFPSGVRNQETLGASMIEIFINLIHRQKFRKEREVCLVMGRS